MSRLILAVLVVSGATRIVADQIVYFLVKNPRGFAWGLDDSYVLPLSKQEEIDHARLLISLGGSVFIGSHQPLVLANVSPGKDGINRDYVDPKFPEWSWHVVEFLGFADFSAEILDGTPTGVESGFDGAQPGEGKLEIGFWAYTVVRELGPVPLYLSIMPEGRNLGFNWSGVGTNYLYTLEGTESLANTNWFAVPGASWPLKTNHWTVPLTNATSGYYRVRAEQAQ